MKFRKKPVVVEAMQFVCDEKAIKELREFCGERLGAIIKNRHPGAIGMTVIMTLNSKGECVAKQMAKEGDWIIKNAEDGLTACDRDIFEELYEPVPEKAPIRLMRDWLDK